MYQATQTYARNALQSADPRNQEAQLLMNAAAKLQAVKDNWDDHKQTIDHALMNNQKLWSAIVVLVVAEDNQLPIDIKRNINNLANFTFNHTFRVLADPKPEKLDVLISINRNIALGLRGIAVGDEKKRVEQPVVMAAL
jgi:flagellar biosynthesis activator protein FlaF